MQPQLPAIGKRSSSESQYIVCIVYPSGKSDINPLMLPMGFTRKLFGAFGLLSLAFVSEAFSSQVTRASAMQAPTLKELKNASYSGIEGLKGSVKLVDGKWKGGPYGKGSASRPVVSLVGDLRMTGDLDGNGTDDAVVLLNHAPGGTG